MNLASANKNRGYKTGPVLFVNWLFRDIESFLATYSYIHISKAF